MSKLIAIDFDEVLAESIRGILDHNNNTCCGESLTYDQISNYHIKEIPKFKNKEIGELTSWFYDHFIDHQHTVSPVQGAYDHITQLKQQGHRLIVVTARKELVATQTQDRLQQHFPDVFSEVIYTNHFSDKQISKGDVCKDLGVDYFIDDSMYHANEVAQHGIKSFLLHKPRNQQFIDAEHPHITKITSRDQMIVD